MPRPEDTTCLVEITAYTGSTAGARLPPFVPAGLGWQPLMSAPLGASVPSGEAVLRYSDAGWIGEPGDADQPNVPYYGRVVVPLRFARSLAVLPEQPRRAQVQYGVIELANGDGGLDGPLAGFAVAGRLVRVLRGLRSAPFATPYADFEVMLSGVAVGWTGDAQVVRLELRDAVFGLDAPFQGNRYLGTGGAEGTADMADRTKPCTLGFVRNLPPDLVDPASLVYAVHDGPIEEIVAVRDRGVPIAAAGTNHASFAALAAATIAPGTFHTCTALGLFRINFLSAGGFITADVQGDKAGGTYVSTHAGIAERILDLRSSLTGAQIDGASFAALPAGTCGFHWPGGANVRVADAMDRVLASCAGWWGPGRTGVVGVGRVTAPEGQAPAMEVSDAGPVFPRSEPHELPRPALPRYRQRVAYQVLAATQSGDQLAGSLSNAQRQYYGQAARIATSLDLSVLQRYPDAADYEPVPSAFDAKADAETLASDLRTLHNKERRAFAVEIGPEGYDLAPGSVVRLTWPRLGLAAGKLVVVAGIDELRDGSRERVTLTLWG